MAKRTKSKEPVRIREKALANGSKSLYLDIYRDGQRSYQFLKLYIVPEKSPLDKISNAKMREQAEYIKAQKIIELTNNENGIVNKSRSKITLIEWLERYKSEKNTQTATIITSLINCLQAYSNDVQLKNLNKDYCKGFINYLQHTHISKRGKLLSKKSVVTYINNLVCALNEAMRQEIIVSNPFKSLSPSERVKDPESTRTFLSIEEIRSLINTPCKYDEIKRAFLFSCVTGLRVSDVLKLRWADVEQCNGKTRLTIVQKKTDAPLYITINDTQLQFMGERTTNDELIFKLPSLMTIERVLHRWAKDANVKDFTFHVSRHSFATTLLTQGVDLFTVSKLLGHKSIRNTQIYAKVIDQKKDDAMDTLNGLF